MRKHGSERGLTRRGLLRAALAVGSTAGLSACMEITGGLDVPTGPSDLSTYPASQHAWNDALVTDSHGNTVAPHYQLLLFLEYKGSIPPTEAERAAVESCLASVDRAFQRGTGGSPDALSLNGLLGLIGYTPDYFARFDRSFTTEVDLSTPEQVLKAVGEDESKADHYDAVALLTSDRVEVLLAAEQAMRGNRDQLNGVPVSSSLTDVFAIAARRTGFKGPGLVSSRLSDEVDIDAVNEQSPSAMGYKSGFSDNQASEKRVTIKTGPFAGGTTLHVSELVLDLEAWYNRSEGDRVHRMFSPQHSPESVGEVGRFLANDSRINETIAQSTEADAEQYGVVGHTQKVARARDSNFEPRILRRSEAISAETGRAALNFTSIQRAMTDFVETRQAMSFVDTDADSDHTTPQCPAHQQSTSNGCPAKNGILQFVETEHRANFLVPQRQRRALPEPQ
ncbi:DUF7405 family protein [Halocatena marina]|uniref:DUF7405 family protein n=1 Tax=Halocatena marina TaxID=2934937 RepID=UPI00200F5198|nr:hypothetical protein [Halocatena marina]